MKKYRILNINSSSEKDDLIDKFLEESEGKISYEKVKEKLEKEGITVVSESKYNARLLHYRRRHSANRKSKGKSV